MTATTPRLPPGRYGPEARTDGRRGRVLALWLLGVCGLAVALWLGWGAAQDPVTWREVGFSVQGTEQVDAVYDVTRRDPAVPVRCRLEALNVRHAQVGVLTVDVAPSPGPTVRLHSTVRTSERAVTAVVDLCWVVQ